MNLIFFKTQGQTNFSINNSTKGFCVPAAKLKKSQKAERCMHYQDTQHSLFGITKEKIENPKPFCPSQLFPCRLHFQITLLCSEIV